MHDSHTRTITGAHAHVHTHTYLPKQESNRKQLIIQRNTHSKFSLFYIHITYYILHTYYIQKCLSVSPLLHFWNNPLTLTATMLIYSDIWQGGHIRCVLIKDLDKGKRVRRALSSHPVTAHPNGTRVLIRGNQECSLKFTSV